MSSSRGIPAVALILWLAVQTATAAHVTAAPSSPSPKAPVEGISILSGGIGQEEQEEMRRAAKGYNVHVLFATQQGAYLADVSFTVTDNKGRQLAASVSEGPRLYLNLPAGAYQISATRHGASQSRQVKVPSNGTPVSVTFLFPDQ